LDEHGLLTCTNNGRKSISQMHSLYSTPCVPCVPAGGVSLVDCWDHRAPSRGLKALAVLTE